MERLVVGGWYNGQKVDWPPVPVIVVEHPSANLFASSKVQHYELYRGRWFFQTEKEKPLVGRH